MKQWLSIFKRITFIAIALLGTGMLGGISAGQKPRIRVLKSYETLKRQDLKHFIVRRSVASSSQYHEKHLKFKAHGRQFEINLVSDNTIFSDQFTAIEDDGKKLKEILVDKGRFYKGYVQGELGSFVEAHLEDGILTAQIDTKKDSFIVEPSWRHVKEPHMFDMIVYKKSDVMWNSTVFDVPQKGGKSSFCAVHKTHRSRRSADAAEDSPRPAGLKMLVPVNNTCRVALVADYRFFQQMGQGRTSTTVNYMISVLQRVDRIFRDTIWTSGLTGIGFEVDLIKVHSKPSGSSGPEYNRYRSTSWVINDLLTAFSRSSWQKYCLAHLFTYQDFEKGVIGLAYVASADSEVGGICSRLYSEGGSRLRYLNCGLSSSLNWGRRLLTTEADIVTAHELGHNFGADHDPDSASCAPSESNNGKFIMYRTSVSGFRVNNKKFSPCSTASIDKVLINKGHGCFKEKRGAFCGNFEVEGEEECDPGLDAIRNNSDRCCNPNCKFRAGVTCSDVNSPCCENCKPAPVTKKCREEFSLVCTGKTMCDGVSSTCPVAPKLTGPECHGKGKCYNGICKSFCEVYGQEKNASCVCTNNDDVCKLCCSSGSSCTPAVVNGLVRNVDDGHPCDSGSFQGRCLKGKCEKTKQNVLDQFLSLVKDFSASKFAKFMEENIVGTIIIFSLILWIPASCVVHFVDRRRDKEEEERKRWLDPKNTELLKKQNMAARSVISAREGVSPRKPLYKKPVPTPRNQSGVYIPSEHVRARDNSSTGGYSAGHVLST